MKKAVRTLWTTFLIPNLKCVFWHTLVGDITLRDGNEEVTLSFGEWYGDTELRMTATAKNAKFEASIMREMFESDDYQEIKNIVKGLAKRVKNYLEPEAS